MFSVFARVLEFMRKLQSYGGDIPSLLPTSGARLVDRLPWEWGSLKPGRFALIIMLDVLEETCIRGNSECKSRSQSAETVESDHRPVGMLFALMTGLCCLKNYE